MNSQWSGNLIRDANNTYEYGHTQINRYDAEGLRYEMEENGKLVQFIFNENKEVIVEKEVDNITRLIRTSDIWAMESEPEKHGITMPVMSREVPSSLRIDRAK